MHMQIKEKTFRVVVKPNFPKSEIAGYDAYRKAYKVSIKEKAEDNKANKGLIRFLSKTIGGEVRIKSGFKSREKLMELCD